MATKAIDVGRAVSVLLTADAPRRTVALAELIRDAGALRRRHRAKDLCMARRGRFSRPSLRGRRVRAGGNERPAEERRRERAHRSLSLYFASAARTFFASSRAQSSSAVASAFASFSRCGRRGFAAAGTLSGFPDASAASAVPNRLIAETAKAST